MTKSKNDTRDRSGQDKWWWSRLVSFDSIVLSWSFLTIDSGGFSLVCFGDTLIRFEGIVLQIWLFITNKTSFWAWSEYCLVTRFITSGPLRDDFGMFQVIWSQAHQSRRVPPASLDTSHSYQPPHHCATASFSATVQPEDFTMINLHCFHCCSVLSSKSSDGSPSQRKEQSAGHAIPLGGISDFLSLCLYIDISARHESQGHVPASARAFGWPERSAQRCTDLWHPDLLPSVEDRLIKIG